MRPCRNRGKLLLKKVESLLGYAHYFYSGLKPNAHGGNENDHIKALREMGADIPNDSVDFPQELNHLWEMHREIRFSSVVNDDGDMALSPRDSITLPLLMAYSDFTGLNLNKTEINAIMSIDSIFDRLANGNS